MTDNTITLPPHLSHSQVSSMTTCGWRWVLERGIRVPQQPSWATVAGSAIHTATEHFDNWTLSDEWVTDRPTIERIFQEAFDEEIDKRLKEEPDFTKDQWRASGRASKAWPNKENEEWWRANGPSHVMSWVTWRLNNPSWEIAYVPNDRGTMLPGIELPVTAKLGGVDVRGYVDRLFHRNETELMCVDIKTGQEPDSQEQLGTYSVALEETYGVTTTWGAYWLSRTGGTTTPEDMRMWPRERVEFTYKKVRERQERGDFLPKPSRLCGGCSVREFCFSANGAKSDEVPLPWELSVEVPAAPTVG
jgi:putative RecB family exonuclease